MTNRHFDPTDFPAGDPGPLFPDTAPHVAGSETSEQAAREIEPTSDTLRGKVLTILRVARWAGWTDEEMQNRLEMNPPPSAPVALSLSSPVWSRTQDAPARPPQAALLPLCCRLGGCSG